MSTLHLIRTSAFADTNLAQCAQLLAKHDAILLLDDGCYNLKHPSIATISEQQIDIFVIEHHYLARGLALAPQSKSIVIEDIPELMLNYKQSITWQ
ncbi:sulfurtransferase complex subunit TusB [Thalassotalea sp. M1531]|uniref:Sulfurtransferase complex subunit TusB n=1 Tax=Thalassotalea algicola TaxID=2716224 RepID=A0A7Y0LDU1_9GAMM|nr:sulfurtransferase complex subunit TusB [Thalassotalea algicola]NMP32322.1 sulfurtransferase complex subunit TusB [Thalassotalea algicola]